MSDGQSPLDPRWPRLLGLAVHEFRTPITVVSGYIRMLLTNRAGELTEAQQRLLQEAEKSCGRLSGLVTQMSDLAALEGGSASFNRSTLDVGALVQDTIESLAPLPDRDVTVALVNEAPGATTSGDPVRLKTAFASVLSALRRELVTSTELRVKVRRRVDGQRTLWIAIADDDHMDAVDGMALAELGTFDEWRGGSGLSLAIARRVLNAHDGRLLSPGNDVRSAAVVMLPDTSG